jgi:hypothetical protein
LSTVYRRFLFFQIIWDSLSLMTNSIEAEMIKMHLAHSTYDEIVFQLGVGHSRISGTIRAFHQSGIIPKALRIGRLQKRRSELVGFFEARPYRQWI